MGEGVEERRRFIEEHAALKSEPGRVIRGARQIGAARLSTVPVAASGYSAISITRG